MKDDHCLKEKIVAIFVGSASQNVSQGLTTTPIIRARLEYTSCTLLSYNLCWSKASKARKGRARFVYQGLFTFASTAPKRRIEWQRWTESTSHPMWSISIVVIAFLIYQLTLILIKH